MDSVVKNKYQQIGWYGAYTKELQNYCLQYDFEYDLDSIDSLIKFTESDSISALSSTNSDIKCGGGVILYSNSGITNISDSFFYGFLDNEDGYLLKPPTSYFEKFKIANATDKYKEVIGVYTLTDIFRENYPVYKNLETGWYIFSQDGRFRLTNALENFTDGLIGQLTKPNGIFVSEINDSEYAVSEGVEEIADKNCPINARFLIRQSTGARFEKLKKLGVRPRTPRSIDEQSLTETTNKENPSFMEISNFILSPSDRSWVKFKSKIKKQSVIGNTLTLKYEAIASDECQISTPVYEEYQNDGVHIDGLLCRYDAGYRISDSVLDEPIKTKTIRIESPPQIDEYNGVKTFKFNNRQSRNYIRIDDSVGSDHLGGDLPFTMCIRYKPSFKSESSNVLVSKWKYVSGFISPDSSFILRGDSFTINEDNALVSFGNLVNRTDWNNLAIIYDNVNKTLTIAVNDSELIVVENYQNMVSGSNPLVIGGLFTDVNNFSGYDGHINDFRIYDIALSHDDITHIFESNDFESKKKKYELPFVYQPVSNLQNESEVSTSKKIASERRSYVPIETHTGFSPDLSNMVVGELLTTIEGFSAFILKYYEITDDQTYEFKYDEYVIGYDKFTYEHGLVILQNSQRLSIFVVDDITSAFRQVCVTNIKNSNNFKTQVTSSSNGRFIFNSTDSSTVTVLYFPEVVQRSAKNVTPRTIKFRLPGVDVIKSISILDDMCLVIVSRNVGYLMKLNPTKNLLNSEYILHTTLKFTEETDLIKCTLVRVHDTVYLTKHKRSVTMPANAEKYKTSSTFNYEVGHLKLIPFNEDYVLNSEIELDIFPPYTELGEEFLEHQMFGDNIKSDGYFLVVSNADALENSNKTKKGVCYLYMLNQNKTRFNFISRISVNDIRERQNFGLNLFFKNKVLIVNSLPIETQLTGDEIIYAHSFNIDDVPTDHGIAKQLKYEHEKYDSYFKLIAWYRFNGMFTEIGDSLNSRKFALLDNSGEYNHLTCFFANNPFDVSYIGPTEGDMSYKFDKFSHGTIKLLDFNNSSFTLNIWYLVSDFNTESQSVLLSMFDSKSVSSDKGFILYSNGDFKTGTDITTIAQELSLVTETNVWNMLTLVYDNDLSEVKFYINATERKNIQNVELTFENNMLSIGGITYTKFPFYGNIDDLKIYKKVLTKDDIDYEYEKSWKFEWIKT
jgi:hypothetical protein